MIPLRAVVQARNGHHFRAREPRHCGIVSENLRLEAARQMLERGRLTLDQIAAETGFSDRRRMREFMELI